MMSLSQLVLTTSCLLLIGKSQDISPLMNLLRPESMNRIAEIATELGSLATSNVANNERDIGRQVEEHRENPLGTNLRPSQVLGQAISSVSSQSRNAFLGVLAPFEKKQEKQVAEESTKDPIDEGPLNALNIRPLVPLRPKVTPSENERSLSEAPPPSDIRLSQPASANAAKTFSIDAPPTAAEATAEAVSRPLAAPSEPVNQLAGNLAENPFMKLANTFLRGASGASSPNNAAGSSPQQIPSLGIKDFVPGADSNFGIPKGEGCLPFLSEFLQVAYGNCQQVADEKAFDAWGNELKNAILTGEIDLLKASQETCRRGAERQQCASLRQALATCDILQSLQIGAQLQRAMKRCEEVSGLVDQNPMAILGQINNLIGGEFAQGFFNNFLGGNQKG